MISRKGKRRAKRPKCSSIVMYGIRSISTRKLLNCVMFNLGPYVGYGPVYQLTLDEGPVYLVTNIKDARRALRAHDFGDPDMADLLVQGKLKGYSKALWNNTGLGKDRKLYEVFSVVFK